MEEDTENIEASTPINQIPMLHDPPEDGPVIDTSKVTDFYPMPVQTSSIVKPPIPRKGSIEAETRKLSIAAADTRKVTDTSPTLERASPPVKTPAPRKISMERPVAETRKSSTPAADTILVPAAVADTFPVPEQTSPAVKTPSPRRVSMEGPVTEARKLSAAAADTSLVPAAGTDTFPIPERTSSAIKSPTPRKGSMESPVAETRKLSSAAADTFPVPATATDTFPIPERTSSAAKSPTPRQGSMEGSVAETRKLSIVAADTFLVPTAVTDAFPISERTSSVVKTPTPRKGSLEGSVAESTKLSTTAADTFLVPAAVTDTFPTPERTSPALKTPSPRKVSKAPSVAENLSDAVSKLVPQGQELSNHVEELTETVKKLTNTMDDPQTPGVGSNIDKIAHMSQVLTNEANALRASIRGLSEDIERTKIELITSKGEDVNFPYHLFLVEMIVNKIHMKCDCFNLDSHNLVISATFLGKTPIVLYDSSYGKIESFSKLNVGKSTLFAMTYDKICGIDRFEIHLQMTKEPPCTNCVTKIAETRMDYTQEFITLREELCKKWTEEKPNDNIICTTSTPLSKSMFYLVCGDNSPESIGIIEVSVRMSFLGKEITTAFSASPKPRGTNMFTKEDNGMMMYSSQKVEMDDSGKILLDEDVLSRKELACNSLPYDPYDCPSACPSNKVLAKRYDPPSHSRVRGYSSQHGYQG